MNLEFVIWVAGIVALIAAVYLYVHVKGLDTGSAKMQEVANAIREGAYAFMRRQYSTILGLSVIVAILLSLVPGNGWRVGVAFIVGALASALSGFIGMYTAVLSNLRVAAGAQHSLNRALQTAFRGGAITGLAVTTLSLVGVYGLFKAFGGDQSAPFLIVGFGFGASFVALFAQLGGGIYTKAADVGADLVGKVEAGIPEDDPRNPAVVADLVGDNVGDCAGRGADLFESTAAENIGAMILGVALFPTFGMGGIMFPLVARAFGIIAAIVGIFTVKAREDEDPMRALNRGFTITALLVGVGLWYTTSVMLTGKGVNYWYFTAAAWLGLGLSWVFVWITQYYTEYRYRPVKSIAEASLTGPATNIISGLAVGMESTALPVIAISIALFGAHWLGEASGLKDGGLYGTAVATMGMLATVAYVLAMDTYGPITDNAGGIVEMSEAPKEIRDRTDKLDASGNTTKALTKGYAVGSAALAAFLLFSAYLDEVKAHLKVTEFPIDLGKPVVFIGALIGAALVFIFCSFAIQAVGKAAQVIIQEVRRQFKADPGIMEGTSKPNYAAAVDIVTKAALREMILPGALVVVVPILVGVLLRAEAAGAMLMSATITGVIMALFLNNGGGAWDNAKKYIETGAYGGKRSEPHKAAVVGDTVGDPFKDTAGPSLHVLIKLLSTITLVLVTLFI